MEVGLRFNTRHSAPEFKKLADSSEDWEKVEDGDGDSLAYRIEERCVLTPKILLVAPEARDGALLA